MLLTLYQTLSDDNVIGKTLITPVNVEITLKKDVDVINPKIILTRTDSFDPENFNYAEIQVLKRKYFITDYEVLNYKQVQLTLACDLLETYKDDILASNGVVKVELKSGMFGEVDCETTGRESVRDFISNKTLTASSSLVMSTIGRGANG